MKFLLAIVFTISFLAVMPMEFHFHITSQNTSDLRTGQVYRPSNGVNLMKFCQYEGGIDKYLKLCPQDPSAYFILVDHVRTCENSPGGVLCKWDTAT